MTPKKTNEISLTIEVFTYSDAQYASIKDTFLDGAWKDERQCVNWDAYVE